MREKLVETIRIHGLVRPSDKVVVGVSGGADSVALGHALRALRESLRIEIALAHLHHGMRDIEADEDEQFVRELAEAWGCRFYGERADVPALAKEHKESLEMAARQARYVFFARAIHTLGATRVATAHTLDDQAETILLRMVRGSGPQGLGGIRYHIRLNGVEVIRPMRDVTHQAAINYLEEAGQPWREDRTNQELHFQRNRIRHEILPMLESTLNPKIRESLLRLGEIMHVENAWMQREAGLLLEPCRDSGSPEALDVTKLVSLDRGPRRRVLILWLASAGVDPDSITFDMVERVEKAAGDSEGSMSLDLGSGWKLVRVYNLFHVEQTQPPAQPFRKELKVPGDTVLEPDGLRVGIRFRKGIERWEGPAGVLPAKATISRQAVGGSPLYLRSWQPGDRIRPLGMDGSRKLQDIFVDSKIGQFRRDKIPVLECRDEIVWFPGYRVARGWEVPAEDEHSIEISVQKQ